MSHIYVMILFLIAGLAILFLAHGALYFSVIRFFSIETVLVKKILASVLGVLALSFFFSMFLVQWKDILLAKVIYFAAGFWIGLLINILMALAAVWLIHWATRNFGFVPNLKLLAVVFFSAAFIFSLLGVWQAFQPRVKNISVKIAGLSQEWKGKKIVQVSDAHFGAFYRETFGKKIVSIINDLRPEAVFITGDLLDGESGRLDFLPQVINEIKAEKGVFFITGNHETYLGLDNAYQLLGKTQAKILDDENFDLAGINLIGISYPEMGDKKDVVAIAASLKKEDRPNFLLYHAPVKINEFKDLGIDLQLAGHAHKGQLFPLGFITKLIYGGFDYGLHRFGNYTLYTSSGAGTWGPPLRTSGSCEIPVITLE